ASSLAIDYAAGHRPDAPPSLSADWQSIELQNLNFSHQESYQPGKSPHSLHDIHLKLQRGRRIAFIGESGSGKSTLLAILRGLYEPQPGLRLSLDGQPLTLPSLNETTTLFPQEPEIFENTIRYNITLGLPFDDADLAAVARTAHFDSVLASLPKGLDSNIQEKGVNLSGGQKQRLALARGILAARQSDIVLLDEPTSSVDPKTEAEIYHNLFAAFEDKVVISALHRLHLLRHFDEIYVLANGRIVEHGSLDHLLSHGPIFQTLWRHQSEAAESRSGQPSAVRFFPLHAQRAIGD
ncbi:MAG: ABC transporter ATP-binding protein, partial [Bryobacterales bacterium]|nr:ABC transporter ATP-binding protein [Bryobacterales bacterium]